MAQVALRPKPDRIVVLEVVAPGRGVKIGPSAGGGDNPARRATAKDGNGPHRVMSSGLGRVADNTCGGWDVYRASKAALNTAVRSLAARHRGATLLTLAPGRVRTDMGGAGAGLDVETSVRGLAEVIAARAGTGGHAYRDDKGDTVRW